MIQQHINHIAFVIDASGSMNHLESEVVDLFDAQVASLVKRSQKTDQETRVTVYMFNGRTECLVFDKDVLRLPSLQSLYRANGSTNLIGSTIKAIHDLEQTAQMYGDHAFLTYVLTDGHETDEPHRAAALIQTIRHLGDNWTIATLVPNEGCADRAKQNGFPADNIMIWDTSRKGMKDLGKSIDRATGSFFEGRARGVRRFSGLFQLDLSNLTVKEVKASLEPVKRNSYQIAPVRYKVPIREFVESRMSLSYKKGCAYYELTKPVLVQEYKDILVMHNGKLYGGDNARGVLGIPDGRIKLTPELLSKFKVFIQSTSVNRALLPGTDVVVMV